MIKITILLSDEDLGEREGERLLRQFIRKLKLSYKGNLFDDRMGSMYGNSFIVKDPPPLDEVLKKLQRLSIRWSSIRFSVDEIKSYNVLGGEVSDDTQHYDFLLGNYKTTVDIFHDKN